MPRASRSLNFGVNISVKELGRISALAKELREFASGSKAAAVSLAIINRVGKDINPQNIDKAAQAIEKMGQAIQRIKTTGTTSGIGAIKKDIDEASQSVTIFKGNTSKLAGVFSEVNKEASKISTAFKAQEGVREVNRQLNDTRNNANSLLRKYEELITIRRKLSQADKEGVSVSQSLVNKAKKRVEKFKELNATTRKNIDSFEKNIEIAKILGVNVDQLKIKYNYIAKEVGKITSNFKILIRSAQERINLEKQATTSIRESTRLQQKSTREIEQAQKILNQQKVKSIELSAQQAKIERERATLVQQKTQIAQTPTISRSVEKQKAAIDAATNSLVAYDERLKITNQLIKQQQQVQIASAQVVFAAARVNRTAAAEEAAAQQLIVQGYTKAAQTKLYNAQQTRKVAEESLKRAKQTLTSEQQLYQTSIAQAKKYDDAQKAIIITNKKTISEQQKQVGFLNKLNEGMTRVIATQLKYFASTILIFGAISKINAAFESIIELSGRTARAFAVSRSAILLFEERFIALQDAIVTTAVTTGISINDVSEAMFQFGSAGLQAEESIAALESTMNLIQATGADVASTTKTIAATYRLMNKELRTVGDQTEQFTKINDVIAATYRDNQVEINDFTQAMKFALPVSRQLNLNFEETSGIIALLHNNFIRGGEAGRALRVIFSRMARQMDQFSEAFGIAIDPNKPLDFLDVMEQIGKRMKTGAITADQVATVFERFGLRGANAFIILAQQIDELNMTIDKLEKTSAGAAEGMALIRRESDEGQIKVFKENMLLLSREALKPLVEIILKVVRAINDFMEAIRGTGIETLLNYLTKLIALLVTVKIATVIYSIANFTLSSSFVVLSREGITTAIIAIQLWSKWLIISTANTVRAAFAAGGLSAVFKVLALSALKAGAALIAAFPYLAIAALIGGLIYLIYKLSTAEEKLVEENKKRIAEIRKEKKERLDQIAAYDKTINKLNELREAYEDNRTTLIEIRKGISEATKLHEELGIAAVLAGDDIDLFIDKAIEQKETIQALIKAREEEEKQKIGENVKKYARDIKSATIAFKLLKEQIERGIIVEPIGVEGRLVERKATQKELDNLRNRLEQYQKTAREAAIEINKLTKTNLTLSESIAETVQEAYSLALSLNASAENAKKFGDIIGYLVKTANNLAKLPLREKIDELNEIKTGLEGLRLKFLFEYDFIIPQEEIDKIKNETKVALQKIEALTKADRNIKLQLLYTDENFKLDVQHAQKNAQEIALTANAAFKDSLEGFNISRYLTIDEYDVSTLYEAVAENTELTGKNLQEGSKQALEFAKNEQLIRSVEENILSQVTAHYIEQGKIIEKSSEIAVIENKIKDIFGDQVKLREFLFVLQQRQIAAASGFELQLRNEAKILDKAKTTNLNRTAILKDEVKIAEDKVKAADAQYAVTTGIKYVEEGLQKTLKEHSKNLSGMIANYRAREESSSRLEAIEKEHLKALKSSIELHEKLSEKKIALANQEHQVQLEILKGKDDLNKIINFGQDRVSQLKAELLNQTGLTKEQKRYYEDLISKGAVLKEEELIQAENNQYHAKRIELLRKIKEETFKQNVELLKSTNEYSLALASNSKILKAKQDIEETDAKIVKQIKDYNKLTKIVQKDSKTEKNFGRERIESFTKLLNLIGDRTKKVSKMLHEESEIKNQFIEQTNTIRGLNLELENTKKVKDVIKITSIEEEISSNKLAQIQNDINVLERERQLQGEAEIIRRFELNNLYTQQANIIKDRIVKEEQRLQNIREYQKGIIKSVNDLYGKQLDNIGEVRNALEAAFTPLVEFDFDQRPFTAAIFASKNLGMNFLEIVQLAPQDIINKLNQGLREGTVDFRAFTGRARELAKEIYRIGAEERELRRAQEDIRAQQFATDLLRVKRALGVGDIDEATAAFDRLGESAQVLDPITGKVDYAATQNNLKTLKELANDIAVAYDKSGDTVENNLKRLNEILGDITEVTTNIAKELEKTKFADVFFEQMISIIRQLKELDGTEITLSIEDVTAQLARFGVLVPLLRKQTGGPIEGSGHGDIVPAMLEPGEFVIPRKTVEIFGIDFFERFRNPEFIKEISTMESINSIGNIQKFRKGGLVGYQGGGIAKTVTTSNVFEFEPKEITISAERMEVIGLAEKLTELGVIKPGEEALKIEELGLEGLRTELERWTTVLEEERVERQQILNQLKELKAGPISEDLTLPELKELLQFFQDVNELEKQSNEKRELLIARLTELGVDIEKYSQFTNNFLENAIIPTLEKVKVIEQIPPEALGPGKKEELLDLPIDRLKEVATLLKDMKDNPPKIDISENTKTLLTQQDIQINLIYKEQLDILKTDLAALDPTNIELTFTETGLDKILSRVKNIPVSEAIAQAGMQTGGSVSGIGSGDIIPALLEPGEFVIRKDVVDKLGISFFNSLNRFKYGGIVGMQIGGELVGQQQQSLKLQSDALKLNLELTPFINQAILRKEFVDAQEKFDEIDFEIESDPFIKQLKESVDEFEKIKENTKEVTNNVEKIKKELEKSKTLNVNFVRELQKVAKAEGIDISKWGKLTEYASELRIDPIIISQMQQLATETDSTSAAIFKLTQESEGYLKQVEDLINKVRDGQIPISKAINGIRIGIDKFQSEVTNANKEIVEFTNLILNAFGPKIRAAIQYIGKTFQDVFGRMLPVLFGGFLDSFINTQVDIVASANEAAQQAADSYFDARADLVESLKRNEISYFDYFNRLEDLNKDTSDNMAEAAIEAEQQRVEAVGDAIVGLTNSITDEVNKWINEFDNFFARVVDGFVGIGNDIADTFSEVSAFIGQTLGTAIGAVGVAGGGGIAAAIGAITGTAAAPGVGTAIGGGIGLAAGAIVGGVVGSVFKTTIPIIGDILKAFEEMTSAAIKGILDIIPYIVELGTMTEKEFANLFGGLYTDAQGVVQEISFAESVMGKLPEDILTFTKQFEKRLPEVVDKFTELLPNLITYIIGGVNEAGQELEGAIPTVFRVVSDNLGRIIDLVTPQFFRFFNSILDELPNLFTSIFVAIANNVKKLTQGTELTDLFQNIVDTIVSVFNSFASDFVVPISNALRANLPTIINTVTDVLVEAIPTLTHSMVIIINAMIEVLKDPAVQQAIQKAVFTLLSVAFEAVKELLEPIFGPIIDIVVGIGGFIASISGAIIIANVVIDGFVLAVTGLLLLLNPVIFLIFAFNTVLIAIITILGSIAFKAFIDIFTFFGDVFERVTDKLEKSAEIRTALDKLQKSMDKLFKAFGRLFKAFAPNKANPDLIEGVANAIVFFIEKLTLLVPVIEFLIDIVVLLVDGLTFIVNIFTELIHIFEWFTEGIQSLMEFLIENIPYLNDILEVLQLLGQLISTVVIFSINNLIDAWNDFVEFVGIILEGIFDSVITTWQVFISWIVDILQPIFDHVRETWQTFIDFIDDILQPILDPVMEVWQTFIDFIDDTVVQGFENLKDTIQDIIDLIPGTDNGGNGGNGGNGDNRFQQAGEQLAQGNVGSALTELFIGHQGGIFSAPTDAQSMAFYEMLGLRSNEGLALLLEGEGILTKTGVNTLGGANVLSEINSGQNPFTDDAFFKTIQFDVTESSINLPEWMLSLFHTGGIFKVPTDQNSKAFYEMLGLRSNEGLALLLEGEGILTKTGVNTLGGANVLSEINSGNNPYISQTLPPTQAVDAVLSEGAAAAQAAAINSAYSNTTPNIEESVSANTEYFYGNNEEPIYSGRGNRESSNVTNQTNNYVNIDMSNSNFQSESVAEDVENQIVGSMQNQEGAMFEEINEQYGTETTMSGIRRR